MAVCHGAGLAFHAFAACSPGNWAKGSVGSGTEPEFRGGGLGRLHEPVEASRGAGWRARGQAQVGENLDDHGGIFNGRDERQGATTVGTGGHVDLEHSFEQLGPVGIGQTYLLINRFDPFFDPFCIFSASIFCFRSESKPQRVKLEGLGPFEYQRLKSAPRHMQSS